MVKRDIFFVRRLKATETCKVSLSASLALSPSFCLTSAHGFLTATPRTAGPGSDAWSLPAAAEGIVACHRALLPIPGGTHHSRRLPGATAWSHGCTLLPGLHAAMSSRGLGSPSSQRQNESSARLAHALGLRGAGEPSVAAALPALPERPGKAHAALPLALRQALPGVAGRGSPAVAAMALRVGQDSRQMKLRGTRPDARLSCSCPAAAPPAMHPGNARTWNWPWQQARWFRSNKRAWA